MMPVQLHVLLGAVEVVLLDHIDEISGDGVEPNMAELAHCWGQVFGYDVDTVLAELAKR
jgi:hypothetical protein